MTHFVRSKRSNAYLLVTKRVMNVKKEGGSMGLMGVWKTCEYILYIRRSLTQKTSNRQLEDAGE